MSYISCTKTSLTLIMREYEKQNFNIPPENTAHGALLKHITTNANKNTFQPMNINFGLMPDINSSNDKKKYLKTFLISLFY